MFYFTKFILLIFSFNLFANTINVSVNGSDETGNGSADNPYATIQKE